MTFYNSRGQRIIGLLVLLLAYVMLVPGLFQPMISITGTVEKAEMMAVGKEVIVNHPDIPALVGVMAGKVLDSISVTGTVEVYHKTRSILGTVEALFDAGYYLVGFLIMLFSVIIPVLKGLLMLLAFVHGEHLFKRLGLKTASLISKWSMADVFVVAIIVAYLAFNATEHSEDIITLVATLGEGFYYFLTYCVLSILSAQLLGRLQVKTS